ncbi:MAG: SDR family NAD(P)-dependent oxidoreductase [Actinomycetota bacterium]|nr:SDR family NAD(P)-dependent oxidoreductase [Actinomycetota bacterium]
MKNALGQSQTIVLLGGNSDIGVAIVRAAVTPFTRQVVLACRDTARGEAVAATLRSEQLAVAVEAFEGGEPAGHEAFVAGLAERFGNLDLVIVAYGLLGDAEVTRTDVAAAVALAQVNFTGTVGAIVAVGNQLVRQGSGSLVVLSSVAGERVRAANPVYGGTKAGIDGFCQGYGDWLAPQGVHLLLVRPGFVHSAMTQGMKAAPFATSPEKVAEVTIKGLRARRRMVWAPPILRVVFSVLRHVPGPVWRRLPLG